VVRSLDAEQLGKRAGTTALLAVILSANPNLASATGVSLV